MPFLRRRAAQPDPAQAIIDHLCDQVDLLTVIRDHHTDQLTYLRDISEELRAIRNHLERWDPPQQ
jgi:hypothetical protein